MQSERSPKGNADASEKTKIACLRFEPDVVHFDLSANAIASRAFSGPSPPPQASIPLTKFLNAVFYSGRTKNSDSTIGSESQM